MTDFWTGTQGSIFILLMLFFMSILLAQKALQDGMLPAFLLAIVLAAYAAMSGLFMFIDSIIRRLQ